MLTFASPQQINLRPYQADAIQALRDGIRAGKRRLILCAGTGAGKTLTAAQLLKEAARKESYSLFIVDRVSLVDQTSAVFDAYGIKHGVVQGDHPRWEPREHVQVCSAQTLARRSLPRAPSLIVVDEAHCQFKATLALMDQYPDAVKVGLTATPFTAGMAEHWDGIVNVRSTRDLIGDGHLIEPTIYVGRAPEDAELSVNGMGEFSDESAAGAGVKIIGDVVTEWLAKVNEHFGGPVKTIVFTPTVEHGRELCTAFAAAGQNFQQISYLDKDEDKAERIAEFRRPDSIIMGLVSCGVLTKGFDVPDCLVGVSCKPYRKSLSSHMQEIGRIMRPAPGKTKALWLCLARGSRVLTDRGLVPIQFVTTRDKVWDGENFVSHGGAICKGIQNVITYQGLTATEGHLVHTMDGWRTFGSCASEQIRITQTGLGRAPIRIGEDRLARRAMARRCAAPLYSCGLRVPEVSLSFGSVIEQLGEWAHWWMSCLRPARAGVSVVALCAGAGAEASLRKPKQPSVFGLWRSRYQVQLQRRQSGNALDNGEPWHSRGLQVQRPRPYQPGWELRTRKFAVAGTEAQLGQPFWRSADGQDALVSFAPSASAVWGSPDEEADFDGAFAGADCGAVERGDHIQEQAEVWDILDAGPHNRFTCNGLLVHNCHSGNVERFAADTFDVWENGAGELSAATKRDATARKRDATTREKAVCPECHGALRANVCLACGWERPARSGIVAVDGTLVAFDPSRLQVKARDGLRADCLSDPRVVWDAALAYCLDRKPHDEDKARRWAYGVWAGVYDGAKLPRGWYGAAKPLARPDAYALIDREVKRFRTRRAG